MFALNRSFLFIGNSKKRIPKIPRSSTTNSPEEILYIGNDEPATQLIKIKFYSPSEGTDRWMIASAASGSREIEFDGASCSRNFRERELIGRSETNRSDPESFPVSPYLQVKLRAANCTSTPVRKLSFCRSNCLARSHRVAVPPLSLGSPISLRFPFPFRRSDI